MINKEITEKLEAWCLERLKDNVLGNETDLLSKLTVVIPSYNRQNFLLRQIVYWHNSLAHIVILDGSSEPINTNIQDALKSIPQFTYIHNKESMIERLSIGAEYIKTPYVVLLGDDEIHLRTGLRKAIRKLEEKQDVAGCIGQSLRFCLSASKDTVMYGTGYQHFGFKTEFDSIKDRLVFALGNYNAATCYAVLRKEVWVNSWGSLLKTSCKDVCEIQQAISTHLCGKFTTVDEIYWLRSDENVSILDEQDYIDLSFPLWWKSVKYKNEREELVNTLVQLMMKYSSEKKEIAIISVLEALETYYGFITNQNAKSQGLSVVKIKGFVIKVFKKLFGTVFYNKIKECIIKPANRNSLMSADLGARKELYCDEFKNLFVYNSETEQELLEVEELIFDFYQNH